MHRAERILEAVRDVIEAAVPSSVKVYTHRRDSLAEDQGELPAITVDFGEDTPVESMSTMDGVIGSLLTVNVTSIVVGDDEVEVRRKLLELRTLTHIGIRRSPQLALPFVIDTHYGGANPPEVDVSGDTYVGLLTCPWGVQYEMNINNPSE